MMLSLSRSEQKALLFIVVLFSVVAWIYFSVAVRSLWSKTKNLSQQVAKARQEVDELDRLLAREPTLRNELKQMEDSIGTLRDLLPEEEELSTVVEHLRSDLSRKAGMKILTIFPQRNPDFRKRAGTPRAVGDERLQKPSVYKAIGIQIEALSGYHELGKFLSLVESEKKPLRVASLRIAGRPEKDRNRHEIKLVLRSYFSVKE